MPDWRSPFGDVLDLSQVSVAVRIQNDQDDSSLDYILTISLRACEGEVGRNAAAGVVYIYICLR